MGQSQRADQIQERPFGTGRRQPQSAADQLGRHYLTFSGATPFLSGGPQRRRAVHAAAGGAWRRPENAERARGHAADRGRRASITGKANRRALTPESAKRSGWRPLSWRSTWQRHQCGRRLRRLQDGGRSRIHAAVLPAEYERTARPRYRAIRAGAAAQRCMRRWFPASHRSCSIWWIMGRSWTRRRRAAGLP